MQCLVLAGGLGTRMRPATERLPKALLDVAGRPFVEWQLKWLAAQGVTDVVLSTGYRGQMLADAVGDGGRFGLTVRYAHEGETLRGTAGALRLALELGLLADRFFVLYGDSYLSVNLADVDAAHAHGPWPALMTVFDNAGHFDQSNVVLEDGRVARYEKGVSDPPPEMHYIDYGLSVLERQLVEELVPEGVVADLATVYEHLARRGDLGALLVSDRFYEIGSPEGLAALEAHLSGPGTPWP